MLTPAVSRSFRRVCIPLALTLGVALTGQTAAQTPADEDTPTPADLFGETINVRIVNVEAVVTDRDGRRVPDLELSDFVLWVDDEQVPIDYFAEVRDGSVRAPEDELSLVAGLEAEEPAPPTISSLSTTTAPSSHGGIASSSSYWRPPAHSGPKIRSP